MAPWLNSPLWPQSSTQGACSMYAVFPEPFCLQTQLLQVLVFPEYELCTVLSHILQSTLADSKDLPCMHGGAGDQHSQRFRAGIGFIFWNLMWACYWMMEGLVSCSNFWFFSREESTATTMGMSEACHSPGLLSLPAMDYSKMNI